MYIDEHGRRIYQGKEAIDNFLKGLSRLRENRKLHYKTTFQEIPISVENRKGSIRRGTDPDGKEWETKHKKPYGYIPGTEGADGDAVDVFVGSNPDAAYAYVIHINNPETGKFDEDKVFLGFDSEQDALHCFRQHYDDPKKFYDGMDIIPMWKFRDKVFVKKETSRKLVASTRGGTPKISVYDRGQQLLAPFTLAATFYPAVLGSLKTHEDMEAFPEYDSPDTMPTALKKKKTSEAEGDSLQVPSSMFGSGKFTHEYKGKQELFDSLGTDQTKNHALLGHHQDIMGDPEVREGGPGSGPRKRDAVDVMSDHAKQIPKKVWIEKAGGKYLGSMDNPKGGKIHMFQDPKTKTTLTMRDNDIKSHYDVKDHMDASRRKRWSSKEAEEHGVKGMKWGVSHVRKDAAGQKSRSAMKRDLANDPKTMSMMQHVTRGQSALARYNSQRQQQAQKTGKPPDPKQAHDESTQALKDLGWKVAEAVANLSGLGGAFGMIHSIVKAPSGQKMHLQTDKNGNSQLSNSKPKSNKKRTRASMRESKIYYARSLQRYGKESKDLDDLWEAYPDDDIVFPTTRRHSSLGMGYFHKKIDKAKEVVITGFRGKRKITAGVASEARHALHKGIPVRFLHKGKLRTVASIRNIEGGRPDGHYAKVIFKKKHKK